MNGSSAGAGASPSWLCLQLGAREHYAIPRALQMHGALAGLLTDQWHPPGSPLAVLPCLPRLRDRWHPQLAGARVWAPNARMLLHELGLASWRRRQGWAGIQARNAAFQRLACARLQRLAPRCPAHTTLFAFSYAALRPLELARRQGWRSVLGQIDPGPEEERIVAAERRRYPALATAWQPAPSAYWQLWRRELDLADRILINSRWSAQCLLRAGVPAAKLRLVPLIYEAPPVSAQPRPPREPSSPFQLLFLGTIGLRKGIARLLEAMRQLEACPVQLTLAGPTEIDPLSWAGLPNVRWIGPVPRSRVGGLYVAADALILPTLSDGFALTQLEALAHGCPVIVSSFCGEVVTPGRNGWLLRDLDPGTISEMIREVVQNPLPRPAAIACPGWTLPRLAEALLALHDSA